MKKLILIAIILLGSSCATTQPVTVELDCPPPINLPVLTVEQSMELNVLTPDTLSILIIRERMLKQRNFTLCSIIESTHE